MRSVASKGLEDGNPLRVEGDLLAAHVNRAAEGAVKSQSAVGVEQVFHRDSRRGFSSGERRMEGDAHAAEEESERSDQGDDCGSEAHGTYSFHETMTVAEWD